MFATLKARRPKLRISILMTGILLGAEVLASTLMAVAQLTDSKPDSGITLHIQTNSVIVPVVVHDAKGNPVGNLAKGDFTVFDGGKLMAITGFTLVKSPAAREVQTTNAAIGTSPNSSPQPPQNQFILFLVDDRHLNQADLSSIQNAAIKQVSLPLPSTEYMGVFSFTGINSGITRDPAALKAALLQMKAHPIFQRDDRNCPNIDPYTAHQILEIRDEIVFQGAVVQAKSCSHLMVAAENNIFENMVQSAATRALAVGQEDARESLNIVQVVVRAMAKLPGQRTLILVSPGFFSDSPETMRFKSEVLNEAAAANVIISTLDARGMFVDSIGNDHILSELATGTGGTFFHHSNDLENGLRSLTVPPEFLYLLELSLKGVKPNGAYHELHVKVNQPGLFVQARKGYVAPKPDSSNK